MVCPRCGGDDVGADRIIGSDLQVYDTSCCSARWPFTQPPATMLRKASICVCWSPSNLTEHRYILVHHPRAELDKPAGDGSTPIVLLCAAQLSLAASLYGTAIGRAQGHQDWLQHVRRTLQKHPESCEELQTSRLLRKWIFELVTTFMCAHCNRSHAAAVHTESCASVLKLLVCGPPQ